MNERELERFQELEKLAELDGFKKGILADSCQTTLSPREKIVFYLKSQGQSFKKIAVMLSINKSTAYTYHQRAVLKITRLCQTILSNDPP